MFTMLNYKMFYTITTYSHIFVLYCNLLSPVFWKYSTISPAMQLEIHEQRLPLLARDAYA